MSWRIETKTGDAWHIITARTTIPAHVVKKMQEQFTLTRWTADSKWASARLPGIKARLEVAYPERWTDEEVRVFVVVSKRARGNDFIMRIKLCRVEDAWDEEFSQVAVDLSWGTLAPQVLKAAGACEDGVREWV